ncbi:hypothetical protein LshimejAT787_0905730 [Lyophyllum shimeji]|uniref:Uncharacterized protein n=1 Tax=Lyophyllum shimeji TaxID=47721 RepID=A0A9P3PTL8_LYOSH|nr:hypothetical protein LshimejAT787_0905730 [Lyophyllum shimeji]
MTSALSERTKFMGPGRHSQTTCILHSHLANVVKRTSIVLSAIAIFASGASGVNGSSAPYENRARSLPPVADARRNLVRGLVDEMDLMPRNSAVHCKIPDRRLNGLCTGMFTCRGSTKVWRKPAYEQSPNAKTCSDGCQCTSL